MTRYITTNIDIGTITHEDKEVSGLSFDIRNGIIQVTGSDENVNLWVDRVEGVESVEEGWSAVIPET